MDIAKESVVKIRQLEIVVKELQQRIGQIAASYELEIAVLKSQIKELERYVQPEETDN